MKYAVLGFNQEMVCAMRAVYKDANGKEVEGKLNLVDLCLLKAIADLSSRESIRKLSVGSKQFNWITHKLITDDYPILDIKERQLRVRLNKLVAFGLIERHIEKTSAGTFSLFRTTSLYEDLIFSQNDPAAKNDTHPFENADGGGIKMPTTNYTDNNNNKKEIKKKENTQSQIQSALKKENVLDFVAPDYKEAFDLWLEYKRQRKESYKSELSLKQCYSRLVKFSGNSPKAAMAIVERSMANNWAGLFALDETELQNLRLDLSATTGVKLGVGEMINEEGKRYYINPWRNKAIIVPDDAPPRPSDKHIWSQSGGNWITTF